MRNKLPYSFASTVLLLSGCGNFLEDVEPHRDVVVKQWTTHGVPQPPLEVETPAGWTVSREESKGPAGPVTTVHVYHEGQFKIVLVPTTNDLPSVAPPPPAVFERSSK
jgi:hypothetical protein